MTPHRRKGEGKEAGGGKGSGGSRRGAAANEKAAAKAKAEADAARAAKTASIAAAKAAARAAARAVVKSPPQRCVLYEDAPSQMAPPSLACGTLPSRENVINLARATVRVLAHAPPPVPAVAQVKAQRKSPTGSVAAEDGVCGMGDDAAGATEPSETKTASAAAGAAIDSTRADDGTASTLRAASPAAAVGRTRTPSPASSSVDMQVAPATLGGATGSAGAATAVPPRRLLVVLCEEMAALCGEDLEGYLSPVERARTLKGRADAAFREDRFRESADIYTAALYCLAGDDWWCERAGFMPMSMLAHVNRARRSDGEQKDLRTPQAVLDQPRGAGEGTSACKGCELQTGDAAEVERAAASQRLQVVLLSSRAEARIALRLWGVAVSDCEEALRLDPSHAISASRLERAQAGSTDVAGEGTADGADAADTAARLLGGARAMSDALVCEFRGGDAAAVIRDPIAPGEEHTAREGHLTAEASPVSLDGLSELTEVEVHWLPIAQRASDAQAHAFLNAAADLIQARRGAYDALLICSAPPTLAPRALPPPPSSPPLLAAAGAVDEQAAAGPPAAPPKPVAAQADGWSRAALFAHGVRWRGGLPSEMLSRSGVRKGSHLRTLLASYLPMRFSISLFEVQPGSKSFGYYAAATVAFVEDKVAEFGGCDFVLHLNSGAASHLGLLRRLHEVSLGRIAFVEFAFAPRKGIAPWLLAAFRLAPLLDERGRTVVTCDVHDDLGLQNAQVRSLYTKLRREGRELCLTWWLAEDSADDCLCQAALPVPKLKQHVSDRWYYTSGSDGGFGLHAHMDAGMMISTGVALREALLAAHDGETFTAYLTGLVHGAPTIPHGVEEMAWDRYLDESGWERLLPKVLFSVHRSLLAGRTADDPFKGLAVSSDVPHALRRSRVEVDVGKRPSASTCRRAATRRRSTAPRTRRRGTRRSCARGAWATARSAVSAR